MSIFLGANRIKFKRYSKTTALRFILFIALLIFLVFAYADYMESQRKTVKAATYTPLLNLIAKVESNDNYNAYFGKPGNTDIDFTNMTIAQVLAWQSDYVKKGSPSSAVGRYQIINSTLKGLVNELGISTNKKFDEAMQDTMAITLLERRGAEKYVNEELTNSDFAANLAKEWAALPKLTGDNPEASYYAGDGLNKARIEPDKVLEAIEPIEAE